MVEIVYSAQLQVQVAVVSGLVGGLDMNENEVIFLQSFDGSSGFPLIVSIGKASSSLNFNDAQTGIMAYALYQVDSRNHSSALHLWEQ